MATGTCDRLGGQASRGVEQGLLQVGVRGGAGLLLGTGADQRRERVVEGAGAEWQRVQGVGSTESRTTLRRPVGRSRSNAWPIRVPYPVPWKS